MNIAQRRKRDNDLKRLRQIDEPVVQGRPPLVLSKKAVAKELGICLRTVDSLLRTKQLNYRRVGSRILNPYSALLAFLRHDHPSGREGTQ